MKKNNRWIIICCAVIFLILPSVWFWKHSKSQPEVKPLPPKDPAPVAQTLKPPEPKHRNVIRYDEENPAFQEMMHRRKAEYGLEKGVDMIVREDEFMNIGSNTLPMQEILDKIHLEKGRVVEKDLGGTLAAQTEQNQTEHLFSKLKAAEKRFWELDKALKQADAEDFSTKMHEHRELSRIVADYYAYKKSLSDLDDYAKILKADDSRKALDDKINSLKLEKQAAEASLKKQVLKDQDGVLFEDALKNAQTRFWEIEKTLKNAQTPENSEKQKNLEKLAREQADLEKIVADFQVYEKLRRQIEKYNNLADQDDVQLRQNIEQIIKILRVEQSDIENQLKAALTPENQIQMYGVHVVQPGDNVWNIHFNFLKEYFKNQGVDLSNKADEPLHPGMSSGVGKILKFSENMVYIYNLQGRTLSKNLNLIHPLSKIVVFNMGQAFDLLSQIDHQNIKNIRFDGENIWIPASP